MMPKRLLSRLFLAAITPILAAWVLIVVPVQAQAPVTWVRGYPQVNADGCVWYVAVWSDDTYTTALVSCPVGVVGIHTETGATAEAAYPEAGPAGCVWRVTKWSDGTYSTVPVSCPAGVIPAKPGTGPVVVAQPPSLAPSPTPVPARRIGVNSQMRTIGLNGFVRIVEQDLLTQKASFKVNWAVSDIPAGWGVGWRVTGGRILDEVEDNFDEFYLGEGVLGGGLVRSGTHQIVFASSSEVRLRVQVCLTAIDVFHNNDVRLSNLCARTVS